MTAPSSALPGVDPRTKKSQELYFSACGSTPVSLGPLGGSVKT